MLLFGLGKYVDKAMALKQKYAPLTKYQMDLVENREKYEEKLRAVEEEYSSGRRHREDEEIEADEDFDEPDDDSEAEEARRMLSALHSGRSRQRKSWPGRSPEFPRKSTMQTMRRIPWERRECSLTSEEWEESRKRARRRL